jgi:hypothetical protein
LADAIAATEAPSQGLCDLVANLTEEGLELVRRVLAFTADYRRAGADFDVEVEALDPDDERYKSAAVRSGLPVLHAMVEQMGEAVCAALGIGDEDLVDWAAA